MSKECINCKTCNKANVCRYKNDYYCTNNSQKLRWVSDKIISSHFPWLSQMYYDDFYSIAGEVLWKCLQQFDSSKDAQFETYLINCLTKKFKTRVTYMNRQRRNNGIPDVSLETLIEDKGTCLLDVIPSYDKTEEDYSDKMTKYLSRLSEKQKNVLFAMADKYTPDEIKEKLKISSKELSDICATLRSYRNISVLF